MKTLKLFGMAAVLLMVASCGTGKKTTNSSIYGAKVEEEECITLYMQNPGVRAYGQASHFKESSATSLAEAQARAMFARKIESAVLAATEEVAVSMEQYAGGNSDGMSVSDQSAEGNTLVQTIAQQVVKNTSVIKTNRYFGENRQFTVFVCMEYGGGESALAEQIESAVKERISPNDRKKIEERHDKFRNRILSQMDKK